jgi:peptidyl-prolyl cis-trans isomerase B (cyclophilin B)
MPGLISPVDSFQEIRMNSVVAAVVALLLVLAPVKSYVKPGEPVAIRFAQTQSEQAQKLLAAVGFKALDVSTDFKDAAADQVVDSSGKPNFKLYKLDGGAAKLQEAKAGAKADLSHGTVDVAAYFPQVKEPGTYILTWQSAQPLVIETLGDSVPWGFVMNESKPMDQRAQVLQSSHHSDVNAIHIVPLQYALISTDKGDIKATFAYDVAPHTAENFISLADQKFYDGTAFHRIIKDFMIQGGDSLAKTDKAGSGGPGYNLAAEFSEMNHAAGVLSMARTGLDPNTAGSQFFIVTGKADFLNRNYTAFGQVIDGMDVVKKIAQTPVTDDNGSTKVVDRPEIKSIRILPATAEMYGIK